jgi:hypothetical protein
VYGPNKGIYENDGQVGSMEPEFSTAIRAQLLTLPEGDGTRALARLMEVVGNPERLAHEGHQSPSDPTLWTIRLSGRLRALVRVEDERVQVLAIAPVDQMTPYLQANGKRVA